MLPVLVLEFPSNEETYKPPADFQELDKLDIGHWAKFMAQVYFIHANGIRTYAARQLGNCPHYESLAKDVEEAIKRFEGSVGSLPGPYPPPPDGKHSAPRC